MTVFKKLVCFPVVELLSIFVLNEIFQECHKVEGIFRISPLVSEVKELKERIERGIYIDFPL